MKNYIRNKYYRYIPGEFFPVYDDRELVNKREFHKYKLARFKWHVAHMREVYNYHTHQAS